MRNTMNLEIYNRVLEKRASEGLSVPDYGVDSQAIANGEVESNSADQRSSLGSLLDSAKNTEKTESKQMGKLFPTAKKTPGTSSSSALLKVAMHEAFFSGVRQTDMLKVAEMDYLRAAYQGFEDEMDKLGGLGSKVLAKGSVVSKMPTKAKALTRHGAPAPRKAALTLAEEARFSNAPKQVGSGVWKIASSLDSLIASHPAYR